MSEPPPKPDPIDAVAWQERLDKMSDLLGSMITVATEQATRRCPYKNRLDQCTAQFGCRNQRRPLEPGELKVCGGDDKIDYRPAWVTEAPSWQCDDAS